MVGSIVVVGAQTRCALFRSMCDLKTKQMNVQRSCLIRELLFYEFERGHNSAEAAKNIFCANVKAHMNVLD